MSSETTTQTASIDTKDYFVATHRVFRKQLGLHITYSRKERKFWFSEDYTVYNMTTRMSVTVQFFDDHAEFSVGTYARSSDHNTSHYDSVNVEYSGDATFVAEYDDMEPYEYGVKVFDAFEDVIQNNGSIYDSILSLDEVDAEVKTT